MKRSTESLINFARFSCVSPSFLRSCSQVSAIASAKRRFCCVSVRMMNCQGCALCAEGAHFAALRISRMASGGTGRWVYFLMLRRCLIASVTWDITSQLFNGSLALLLLHPFFKKHMQRLSSRRLFLSWVCRSIQVPSPRCAFRSPCSKSHNPSALCDRIWCIGTQANFGASVLQI